ncbi:AsnC family protein [Demequina sp. NBRC 110057]|uniref:AsnC family protein n=1 Tax=Demequina sp. NBRC 110057 TaxID=1570346 RepID=UPI001F43343D|nr:AsnC family protein [Demequina sp. NBRC 110057]
MADARDPDGVRSALQEVRRQRAQIERDEAAAVRRARNDGLTWEQIAVDLGVTRQAVHKKHRGRGPGRSA